MNQVSKLESSPLDKLREPFPPHQISKLPKPFKKDSPKGKCRPKREGGDAPDWQDHFCGGHHGLPAVHLDYVGHAALTDRLLDTDPQWSWEPLSTDERGLPALDQNGGLWIRLTVCGVTRLGYGHAGDKRGGDAIKEVIGDALRNAAMRFGAALDLWHKGDLHADEEADEGHSGERAVSPPASNLRQQLEQSIEGYTPSEPIAGETVTKEYAFPAGPATGITQLKAMARSLWREIEGCGDDSELDALLGVEDNKAIMKQLSELENPSHRTIWEGDGKDNPGIAGLIIKKQHEFQQALGPNILQAG